MRGSCSDMKAPEDQQTIRFGDVELDQAWLVHHLCQEPWQGANGV